MASNLSEREKRAVFADLKTDFIYIAIPFVVLVSVKCWMGSWSDIIKSPDWSLAACIIFGQVASKVSKAVANSDLINQEQYGLYTAKRVALVIIAMLFYFAMLTKPTVTIGSLQILYFFTAVFFHFSDGFAIAVIRKNSVRESKNNVELD